MVEECEGFQEGNHRARVSLPLAEVWGVPVVVGKLPQEEVLQGVEGFVVGVVFGCAIEGTEILDCNGNAQILLT